jgi:hypothetical protein
MADLNNAGDIDVRLKDSAGSEATIDTLTGGVKVKLVNDGLPVDTYSATALTVSASGDNTIVTPASGKAVRLYYVSLSAHDGNGAGVTCILKFGTGGSAKYKVSLTPKAIWARNIGAGRRYLQGAVDAPLVVNLSAAQSIHASIEYEEV